MAKANEGRRGVLRAVDDLLKPDPPAAFDPDWVVPTSDVLREWLEATGLHLTGVAVAGGHQTDKQEIAERLRAVLDDDAPLTEDLAVVLARATGVSVAFWCNFEHNYRVGLAAGKSVIGRD